MDEPRTPAQRKAAERQRKRDQGLIPLEIWVHKDRKDEAKKMAEKMQKSK